VTGFIAHGSYFVQSLVLTAAVYAILAVSLDLAAGTTGLYSLGHAGLFAIGAYSTTLLNDAFGIDVLWLLPISAIGVGLIGAVLGSLSLRVSGLYFAITTFIFTLVVTVILSDFSFTGGLGGHGGPSFPAFPDAVAGLGSSLVWCVALVFAVSVGAVWCIRASPLYPILLAIRDAEPFAAAAGVRTARTKVAVFSLSAALAGLAGSVFSFLGFISPGQFTWVLSVNILVMVILGGMNTRMGPILGAAFVSTFPVIVKIDPFVEELLLGCIFLFVIVFFPRGFMGAVTALGKRVRRRNADVPTTTRAEAVPAVEPQASVIDDRAVAPRSDGADVPSGSAGGADVDGDALALACDDLVFGYDAGIRALDGVSLAVRAGTIHGIIGPNGSGKSTLVNIIAGRLTPTSGTVSIRDRRVETLPASSRPSMGLMRTFQSAVLVREASVRDNATVGLYSTVDGIGRRAIVWPLLRSGRRDGHRMKQLAADGLEAAGLDRVWHPMAVAAVPHGVEQLTQLAAACMAHPSILILDEPLAGLSGGEVTQVTAIIRRLRDAGVTVVVIEHQTRFVFETCDEVTVLAAGEVVKTGPAAAVRADARVREVYLGQ
jgi:branched-chain amino acid transport system permease protein